MFKNLKGQPVKKKLTQQLADKDKEIEFLHGRLERKREKIKDIESYCDNTEGELRRCRDELTARENRIAVLRRDQKRLCGEINQLEKENKKLTENLSSEMTENWQLVKEKRTLKEEIKQLQYENEQLNQVHKALQEAYNHLLAGYPDGMTPTDVRNLDKANCVMAGELAQLKKEYEVSVNLQSRYRDALQQSSSEICGNFHLQNCHVCERLECCDNISSAKQQLEDAAKKVKQLRVRLSNCGHWAHNAINDHKHLGLTWPSIALRNIINEARST